MFVNSIAGAESSMKKTVLAIMVVLGLGAAFAAASLTAQAQSRQSNNVSESAP
jgi:hypothetical protein